MLVANLPYNVATPLVADLLDDVPAIERMLVMVQREVGERLAAGPGTKAYGAVSVKVAYWADGRGRRPRAADGVPAPAEGRVGARRHPPARPCPPADRRSRRGCSASCGPASGSGARCCAGRSPSSSRPRRLRRRRHRPEARAEELDVDAWGRLALAVHEREAAGR